MQFGVCGDPKLAAMAAVEGYDFAEWSVGGLLKPRESEEAFTEVLHSLQELDMPYPVVNCFVPGDLKITGPDVDETALKDYVEITMDRAERAGLEVIVFGSGGARNIPDGFGRDKAHEQLVAFCRMAGPLAQEHGITVVVEPLNSSDCNVLTKVGECGRLVEEVAHPNIRLLVDAYHFMRDGDSYDDLVKYGYLLAHVHIATNPDRLAPGLQQCDFSLFFASLVKSGYNGRVSIEGKFPDPAADLPVALKTMRDFVDALY